MDKRKSFDFRNSIEISFLEGLLNTQFLAVLERAPHVILGEKKNGLSL